MKKFIIVIAIAVLICLVGAGCYFTKGNSASGAYLDDYIKKFEQQNGKEAAQKLIDIRNKRGDEYLRENIALTDMLRPDLAKESHTKAWAILKDLGNNKYETEEFAQLDDKCKYNTDTAEAALAFAAYEVTFDYEKYGENLNKPEEAKKLDDFFDKHTLFTKEAVQKEKGGLKSQFEKKRLMKPLDIKPVKVKHYFDLKTQKLVYSRYAVYMLYSTNDASVKSGIKWLIRDYEVRDGKVFTYNTIDKGEGQINFEDAVKKVAEAKF